MNLLRFRLKAQRRFTSQAKAVVKVNRPSTATNKRASATRRLIRLPCFQEASGDRFEDICHESVTSMICRKSSMIFAAFYLRYRRRELVEIDTKLPEAGFARIQSAQFGETQRSRELQHQ